MIMYPFSRFKSFGFNGLSLKLLIHFPPNFTKIIARISPNFGEMKLYQLNRVPQSGVIGLQTKNGLPNGVPNGVPEI